MKINYWDCDYAESDEINIGTKNNPNYQWIYYCHHPNGNGICKLNNKHNKKDDCKLHDK